MALLREKSWLPKKLPKAIFWVTSTKMGNLFFGEQKALPLPCFNLLLDWGARGEGLASQVA